MGKKCAEENDRDHLISVIVPVYNTALYLRRCLDSILDNTYQKLEVICVNDGSQDTLLAKVPLIYRMARIITDPTMIQWEKTQRRKMYQHRKEKGL